MKWRDYRVDKGWKEENKRQRDRRVVLPSITARSDCGRTSRHGGHDEGDGQGAEDDYHHAWMYGHWVVQEGMV
uniref:Uncharacterized protein n=1 Tax=Nelumbo nucifera TaxID=4432 RepID=A0A822YB11_NELNU|nr:TPA_asm: hypothetical protein HUJ06_028206 [Nelumbo nucifera]